MKGTSNFGIKYSCNTNSLVKYTDSHYDGDGDDCKSASSFVFQFIDGPRVYPSHKQNVFYLLITKVLYRGVVSADTKVISI